MKFQNIDKARYRKHLNIVIAISIICFATLSLAISQGLIFLLTDREGSHFWLNVTGVAISMVIVGTILKKKSQHPFMHEVTYVYLLKHQINLITRKLRAIEAAKDDGNINACVILTYYYEACYQLYNLDDNTITINELVLKQNRLKDFLAERHIEAKAESYSQEMLTEF